MTLLVIDCTTEELPSALAALGLGRSHAVAVKLSSGPTRAESFGLSVLDSPAPLVGIESDEQRAFLSGDVTRWDESEDAA